MQELLHRVHWLRALAITTVLFVLALLPTQANAQCAVTYGDILPYDETTVLAYFGVIDYFVQCIQPGSYDFTHYYSAQLTMWSPLGRTADGSGSSSAYGGGGSVEASALLGIEDEVGLFGFSASVGIVCSAMGPLGGEGGQGTVAVPPKISGGDTLWYLGGEEPGGAWITSLPLTSSAGAATTSWEVTQGENKVTLSADPGGTVIVRSSATPSSGSLTFSQAPGDIKIIARANGLPSAPKSLTARAPNKLVVAEEYQDFCNVVIDGHTWTWWTLIVYSMIDNLGNLLPAMEIGANEKAGVRIDDYLGHTWPTGLDKAGMFTQEVVDNLAIKGAVTPSAHCGGLGVAVFHVEQTIRIGGVTIGSGRRVQNSYLQFYTNFGRPTYIISPDLP